MVTMLVDSGLETLDEGECVKLLRQTPVGRLAVTIQALPAVFPVNYVADEERILFFTGEGTNLRAALEGTVVAFEADHYDAEGRTGWSVMVVGQAREVTDEVTLEEVGLRGLRSWAVGSRDHLLEIRYDGLITGRRLATRR